MGHVQTASVELDNENRQTQPVPLLSGISYPGRKIKDVPIVCPYAHNQIVVKA